MHTPSPQLQAQSLQVAHVSVPAQIPSPHQGGGPSQRHCEQLSPEGHRGSPGSPHCSPGSAVPSPHRPPPPPPQRQVPKLQIWPGRHRSRFGSPHSSPVSIVSLPHGMNPLHSQVRVSQVSPVWHESPGSPQSSPDSMVPFPQMRSRMQPGEQPSPLRKLPSSHSSPGSTTLFPQMELPSRWHAEHPSPPTLFPSSHSSHVPRTFGHSTMPLPQSILQAGMFCVLWQSIVQQTSSPETNRSHLNAQSASEVHRGIVAI